MVGSTASHRDWLPSPSESGKTETSENGRGRLVSRVTAAAVVILGFIGFLGWVLNLGILKSLFLGPATMKANTSLGFILAGITVGVFLTSRKRSGRMASMAAAWVLAALGSLTLVEYLGRTDLGIDQWFFQDLGGSKYPGRMSPVTALCFLLAGVAILAALRRKFRWSQGLSLLILLLSTVPLAGYVLDVSVLYRVTPYTSMALHTALSFHLLALSLLFSQSDHGLMRLCFSDSAGGITARRLLPIIPAGILSFGWVFSRAVSKGNMDPAFAIA